VSSTPDKAFVYRDGALQAEDVPLERIAAAIGTPFYVYSSGFIEAQYRRFAAAFADRRATICFAVKANSNLAIICLLARLGAGADVVSEGEMRRALAAGVPASRIIFSGVGKSRSEMEFALTRGVLQFNVESEPELEALGATAAAFGLTAPVALRVNPDVDARTHAKIATGKKENKFGIDFDRARSVALHAARLPGIRLLGLAVHIGSQLTDVAPFCAAFERVGHLARDLRDAGIELRRLDLGGGLGVRYRHEDPPKPAEYAAAVKAALGDLDADLAFEPGRFLVAEAGALVSRVLYVKDGISRRFVIQDAAMNDLARPALYEAWHDIIPIQAPPAEAPLAPVDIVGPVCETGDTFATARPLPPVVPGDLLAILQSGAYGAAMSSTYNSRPLVPEVLVRGDRFTVIRPRQTYDAMLAQDIVPDWLAGSS
jgi:diaminopimelate decarboxylase